MKEQAPDLKGIAKMSDVHFSDVRFVESVVKVIMEIFAAGETASSEVGRASVTAETGTSVESKMIARIPQVRCQHPLAPRPRQLAQWDLLLQQILRDQL